MNYHATFTNLCFVCAASLASAQAKPAPSQASPSAPVTARAPASAPASGPQSGAQPELTAEERELLQQLHAANLTEIEAAKLAQKRARSKTVKRYANEIVKDHEHAERELARVAAQTSVTLQKPAQDKKVEALNNTSGAANFDHEFITMMGREHEAAIRLVEDARAKAQTKAIVDLLAALLPVLQKHEQHALQQLHNLPH